MYKESWIRFSIFLIKQNNFYQQIYKKNEVAQKEPTHILIYIMSIKSNMKML